MYTIIANPTSGNGKTSAVLNRVERLLKEKGIAYEVKLTEKKTDAAAFAMQAAKEKRDAVIALGGDGSFHDVINGIALSGIEILFVPCGSGNDLMRMFRLPRDPIEALKVQLDSPVRRMDLAGTGERYFINAAGIGFDVDVLHRAEQYKGGRFGSLAYLRGAYHAIRDLKPIRVRMSVDGGPEEELSATIISAGNGGYIGGGMHAIPKARVDDGKLSVVIAKAVSKASVGFLLILFVLGLHTRIRGLCRTFDCNRIRIRARGQMIEEDGEIYTCEDVDMRIWPGTLCTRLPK